MSAKREKPKEAEKPAEGAEGEAPAKKKMAGKTLVLFIILPALLVLGGGGTAAMMLLKPGAAAATPGKKPPPKKADAHGAPAGGEHGAAGGEHGAAGGEAGDAGHAEGCADGNPCYYKLPKQLVNLSGGEDGRAPFLEIELTLEAHEGSAFDGIADQMPRLKDQFQSFLRELRVEDINGSAGSYRLRQELLKRFNTIMAPAKIDAVLVESLLIQGQ
jgi:flagellar FliL protein